MELLEIVWADGDALTALCDAAMILTAFKLVRWLWLGSERRE